MKLSCLLATLCFVWTVFGEESPSLGHVPTSFIMPKFKVNLDDPPQQRWNVVATAYSEEILLSYKVFSSLIPEEYRSILGKLTDDIGIELEKKMGEYGLEIQGIADRVGIPRGDLIIVNLMYEITAKCTSIVAQAQDGTIYHGRNLDFGAGGAFTDFLRSIAIDVDFMKNGSLAYKATTFAGYVGVLTGERPGYFTYSIDEVVVGPMYARLLNVLDGLLDPNASMMGYLIRDLLANSTFDQAVNVMGYHNIIAPAFFILGGVTPGQGVVITRDRTRPIDFWWLDAPSRWYLVETNYDHWLPPPPTDDRLDPANNCMDAMGQPNLSLHSLYNCLSVEPVMNNLTTYTAVMHASEGEYDAYMRRCC